MQADLKTNENVEKRRNLLREAEENEGCKVNLLRRDAQDASPIDREVPVGPALPQRPLEGGEVRVPDPDAAEAELEDPQRREPRDGHEWREVLDLCVFLTPERIFF